VSVDHHTSLGWGPLTSHIHLRDRHR
jgi:hypothetical protein